MIVEFEGQQHEFPDDFSDEDIRRALSSGGESKPRRGWLESLYHPFVEALPGSETQQRIAREGGQMAEEGVRALLQPGAYPGIPSWEGIKGAGKLGLGAIQYATSPLTAPIEALVSQPVGQDVVQPGLEATGVPPQVAGPIGEFAGNLAGAATGLRVPGAFGRRLPPGVRPEGYRLGDVPMSRGGMSQDAEQLRFERDAAMGRHGEAAQRAALAFQEHQAPYVAAETARVRGALSPTGGVVAETPREAGAIVQTDITGARNAAKEAVDARYASARAQSGAEQGAIDVLGLRNMGRSIREELFAGPDGQAPVIIDDRLTPEAAAMTDNLDRQPEDLLRRLRIRIPGRVEAQPWQISGGDVGAYQGGMPELQGLDLTMVDQIRKWLSGMRAAAFGSGERERMRAAAAVLDKFDERIDTAIDSGLFRLPDGSQADPRVLQAWRDARLGHADYKATFFKGGHADPVGRMMEEIVGRHGGPPAIPDKVADFLYGSSGFKPDSKNVYLMRRVRDVLGANSRGWGATKQGLFSRLIEPPGTVEGNAQWTNAKVAQNLRTFLDTEMASTYEPWERSMLRDYADLRARLAGSEAMPQMPAPVWRMGNRLMQYFTGEIASRLAHGVQIAAAAKGIPLPGLSTAARYGTEALVRGRPAREAAAKVRRDMAIVGPAWTNYANAVLKWQAAQTPRTIAGVTLAARNLDHNLRQIGTSFANLAGGDSAPAEQQNQ